MKFLYLVKDNFAFIFILWVFCFLPRADLLAETTLLDDFLSKQSGIKTLECDVEKREISFDREEIAKGRIFLQLPDKLRLELQKEANPIKLEILNGNVEWDIIVAKSPSKTINWHTSDVIRDTPLTKIDPKRSSVEGDFEIDGLSVKRIALSNKNSQGNTARFWVDPGTGLVLRLKRHYHALPEDPESTKELIADWKFSNCKKNVEVPASIFDYQPIPGATVSVTTHSREGKSVTEKTFVPLRVRTTEDKEAADRYLSVIDQRYAKQAAFAADYQDYTRASFGLMVEGRAREKASLRTGKLLAHQDGRFKLFYEELQKAEERKIAKVSAFDQKQFWSSNGPTTHKSKKLVHVFDSGSLSSKIGVLDALFSLVSRESGPLVEKLADESEPFAVPSWILKPFGGLSRESVTFDGQEELNGEKVWHFTAHETSRQRKSEHWISPKDGIPRKVIISNWNSAQDQASFQLTNVEPSTSAKDTDFSFVNDGSWIELSSSGRLLGGGGALKEDIAEVKISFPPEAKKIFSKTDKAVLERHFSSNSHWWQSDYDIKGKRQRIAKRRDKVVYLWNGEEIGKASDPYVGYPQISLVVVAGTVPYYDSSLPLWVSRDPAQKIKLDSASPTIMVKENNNDDYRNSDIVIIGDVLWVRIFERSIDPERQLTKKVLQGFVAELAKLGQQNQDLDTRPESKLSPGQFVKFDELKIGQYSTINGYINMGKSGYLCHTVDGPKSKISLDDCGKQGLDKEYVGWSENPEQGFRFEIPCSIPGPGDGENYPWQHQHQLFFVPEDGSAPKLLLKGSSVQGRAEFQQY